VVTRSLSRSNRRMTRSQTTGLESARKNTFRSLTSSAPVSRRPRKRARSPSPPTEPAPPFSSERPIKRRKTSHKHTRSRRFVVFPLRLSLNFETVFLPLFALSQKLEVPEAFNLLDQLTDFSTLGLFFFTLLSIPCSARTHSSWFVSLDRFQVCFSAVSASGLNSFNLLSFHCIICFVSFLSL
jgi:hypothetical protein